MKITGSCIEGTLTLRFAGELDHHFAREALAAVEERIDAFLPRVCVLDLRELTFMDSSGIGLIMGRSRLMKECGGRLEVRDPQPYIRRVLKLSGIERIVKIR